MTTQAAPKRSQPPVLFFFQTCLACKHWRQSPVLVKACHIEMRISSQGSEENSEEDFTPLAHTWYAGRFHIHGSWLGLVVQALKLISIEARPASGQRGDFKARNGDLASCRISQRLDFSTSGDFSRTCTAGKAAPGARPHPWLQRPSVSFARIACSATPGPLWESDRQFIPLPNCAARPSCIPSMPYARAPEHNSQHPTLAVS